MYDYLIVGAGMFGSVFAYQATQAGKKCLVIDKRDHIGGNCYTENIEGINVHMYGPHIFHTNSDKIWKFVNSLVEFRQFTYSPIAKYGDEYYSLPFNMWTFHQLWGIKTPDEAVKKINETAVINDDLTNLENWALSQVGKDVYDKLIYGYTKKHWHREPRELPSFIIKRLPIRFTYDASYYHDKYVGIPIGGYTKLFEGLLKNIDVRLGVDYFENKGELNSLAKVIVYTGKLDEYFDYEFGELDYRTLKFEHQILDEENAQGVPVINHTHEEVEYTRTIEHKHFEKIKSVKSVLTYEYPVPWGRDETPYYPINDDKNNNTFFKYNQKKSQIKNVIFGGRLADFKYYDMDQVIASALKRSDNSLNGEQKLTF